MDEKYIDSKGREWALSPDGHGSYQAKLTSAPEGIVDPSRDHLVARIEEDVDTKYRTPFSLTHMLLAGGAGVAVGYFASRMMK